MFTVVHDFTDYRIGICYLYQIQSNFKRLSARLCKGYYADLFAFGAYQSNLCGNNFIIDGCPLTFSFLLNRYLSVD